MANRDIGVGSIIVYLGLFWAAVFALFAWVTSNAAPGAPQLAWEEGEPTTTSKLTVVIETEAPDADGNKIDYAYAWTKNGEVLEDKAASSIANRETRSGDVFTVTVMPDDGTRSTWGCSLPWRECATDASNATEEITIGNTPPRARIAFVDPEGNDITEYDGKADVALRLSCFDPDVMDARRDADAALREQGIDPAAVAAEEPEEGAEEPEKPEDPCTYTIAWWPVDAELEEGAVSEFVEPVLPRNTVRSSDGWRVLVTANDGTDDGEPVEAIIRKPY